MSDIIDISEMNFDSLDDNWGGEKISIDFSEPKSSSNFGSGIELLMNTGGKKPNAGASSDIGIEDLNNLENELNDLVGATSSAPSGSSASSSDFMGGLFGSKPSVKFSAFGNDDSGSGSSGGGLGQATADTSSDSKTWDGYAKFNDIPVTPDKPMSSEPKLSKEELMREKFKYLRKLEALEKKGIELTKKYNMDSPLSEMQGEYEMLMEEKQKQNSVKFQGNMMMAIINGIEFLNNRFDPFDVKLEGWGEQINENLNDYDEIFGELYDKYKSKASLAPELKLLFQLGGSAMMVHMTNTMFKSAMPGVDDIFRQNPDLMRQFQSAAVNSMANSNPGFSGFMNGVMNPEPQVPQGRGPPPPMSTQTNKSSASFGNRPDLSVGRNSFVDDGINIRESSYAQPDTPMPPRRSARPEMKGPSDISDILSGLKTKTINIPESAPMANDSSTISINDLRDVQDINMPKRSKRRPKSDKNTVSLDI